MDTELRRLLLETALVGAGYGMYKESEEILSALEVDGCNPLPVATGRAISLISQGLLDDAANQLEALAGKDNDATEADALMALISLRQGKSMVAERYLSRCEQSENGVLSDMARGLRQDFRGGIQHY